MHALELSDTVSMNTVGAMTLRSTVSQCPQKHIFARSAMYVGSGLIQTFRPSVRPFVRPSVTKIIDFCEAEMRGVRTLRSLEETQQRFLAIAKVDPHLTRLATGK